MRPVRDPESHLHRFLPVGRVRGLHRAGGVHAGRRPIPGLRQLRHTEPELWRYLSVGRMERLQRSGSLHTRCLAVASLRQLRQPEPELRGHLLLECVERVRRPRCLCIGQQDQFGVPEHLHGQNLCEQLHLGHGVHELQRHLLSA